MSCVRFEMGDLVPALAAGLLFLLPACGGMINMASSPVRATTDVSEATTNAVGALTDGTTNATKEFLKPLKAMLASMAPGGKAEVNGGERVVLFAMLNHELLRTDIARGRGEHLAAFAHLIGIPAERHPAFFMAVQARYQGIYAPESTPFQSLDRLLTEYYDPGWKDVLAHHTS